MVWSVSVQRFTDDDLYRLFIESICREEVRYAHEVEDGAIEIVFATEGSLGRTTLVLRRGELRRLLVTDGRIDEEPGAANGDRSPEAVGTRLRELSAEVVEALIESRPDERYLVVHDGAFVGSVRAELPPQAGTPDWHELEGLEGGRWWSGHDADLREGPPGLLEPLPGSTPDRSTLIKAMSEVMDYGRYVFCDVDSATFDVEALVRIEEEDTTTVVVTQQVADEHGWSYDAVLAMVILRVHTVPNAIDITADITAALTQRGISCRVVAGLRHDRLFIPHHRTLETLKALSDLQTSIA